MVIEFDKKMNADCVTKSPKSETLNGVIVKIEKGLLEEFLDDSVKSKFDNLDQPTLKIYFEYKFDGVTIIASDRIPYYENPMENSNLGKFIDRYKELKVPQEIKISFDNKGFGKIKLE